MNNILIIKLGALGDVVMATPLISAIQKFHHADELWLLTSPPFSALFDPWPAVNVTAFPRHGWRHMSHTLGWIRRGRFTRIYDLQSNDRSGLLCALSGCGERVGNHTRYPYTHHPAKPWRGQCHIFDRMQQVLASAGIDDVAARPQLPCAEDQVARVAEWRRAHALDDGEFVLLHAGASASRRHKIWPHFGAFAERLRQRGLAFVWLGAEPDRAFNRELVRHGGIDATAAFDIAELAELGRSARFALTNDSGPMHVLSCAGTPVFGLFGPSDWRRNHAIGQSQRAIACVDYDPRYRHHASADCLAAISVDDVWAKLSVEGLIAD